jgi:hypothetical protein
MTLRSTNFRVLPSLTAIVLVTSLCCVTADADTIYKTIDAQGNVSFSNTPPPAGVEAQQIELSPGPTPAEQQQSIQQVQNLEAQSNAIPDQESEPAPADEEEPVVEPTTQYQEESTESEDNNQPVVVEDGYLDQPYRDERLRDGVEDVRDAVPEPQEIERPVGRGRR